MDVLRHPPNYLPSKVVIPGSPLEEHDFSGTSGQPTNTCNNIQTRRSAIAEEARALRTESGSETGCESVSRSDPDSDPNSNFDFNQDLIADRNSDPDFLDSHPNSDPDNVCDPE